uniref:Olfactory receptor n=1 Tax=Denticeps clupeoides TaxID=299321 RepID=A0AAY4ABT9_9TELE
MENGSLQTHFYFTLYSYHGDLRYMFLVIMLIVYFCILLLNISIILVVIKEKSLHEPMYIFISCLSINALYGTTGLFPRLSIDLVSDAHIISRPACFTQIYVIYSYAISEFTILSVMAYDRYVAICHPLHYHNIMTPTMTGLLIAGAFSWSFFWTTVCINITLNLPLCGREITRIYCSNWSVVRLSCVPTVSNNALGMFVAASSVFLPAGFILYTYVRILIVCRRSSSEFRGKALQTCLPHIITFVNYSLASFSFYCDILLNRFELNAIMNIVAVAFSLEFLFIPPLLNPLIYGLTLPEMRKKNPFLRYLPRAAMFSKQ